MSEQRVGDWQISFLAKDFEAKPDLAAMVSPEVVANIVLDLRDARARIKELEKINAAQVEALCQMQAMGHNRKLGL
jgi:hypothetical protein